MKQISEEGLSLLYDISAAGLCGHFQVRVEMSYRTMNLGLRQYEDATGSEVCSGVKFSLGEHLVCDSIQLVRGWRLKSHVKLAVFNVVSAEKERLVLVVTPSRRRRYLPRLVCLVRWAESDLSKGFQSQKSPVKGINSYFTFSCNKLLISIQLFCKVRGQCLQVCLLDF